MILKEKYSLGNDKQYYCKLTEELDQCAGFDTREYPYYKHYLLDYRHTDGFHNFPIRVPGGTVGSIYTDKNNKIIKISIDKDYVVKTYPNDLDEKLEKYIGKKIEFERWSRW